MCNEEINKKYSDLIKTLDEKNVEDGKLKEEDIDKILDVLKEIEESNDTFKELKQFPSNNGILERPINTMANMGNLEKTDVMTMHNPITGTFEVIGDASEYKKKETESFENLLNKESFISGKLPIDPIILFDKLKDEFKLPTEETNALVKVTIDYNEKNIIPSFNDLPQLIKDIINMQCVNNNVGSKEVRNGVTKLMIEEIIKKYEDEFNNIEIDDVLKSFNEETNSLIKELNATVSESISLYNNDMNEKIEKLFKAADELKDTDIDKSNQIKEVAEACTESITLEKFKNSIRNKEIKIKKIDLEKYNKIFREFNYKYENSKFNIYDISLCPHVLDRYLDKTKYTTDDIIKLCVWFCKYCKNMSSDNIAEHTFMYYFIRNIITLDFTSVIDKETDYNNDFYKNVVANLEECIDLLKD